ncbi:hypothetical protein M413DRAFT_449042 [Hebeloma cylindrosporum]|uniref:Uncharacterized protein n=1 Tax=Hebeloma cylindrosporum TaxID=76867 RepID=A0A0C2Y6Q5_HEBCY|nr:hypothetical protein M413DRAFT_449042 [Hebeloma cylindrosporum h7]
MSSSTLLYREIQLVIQATLSALSKNDLEACLFGSAAAALYGMDRIPKDVDLLVLNAGPGHVDEEIKRLVASTDPTFSLIASRVVGADHHVLWYNLPIIETHPQKRKQTNPSEEAPSSLRRACKVDILIPGTLDIPSIPKSQLHFDTSSFFASYIADNDTTSSTPKILPIACVPFCTLLMLKLRAWADHSLPKAPHVMHQRIPQDEEDIQELLRISITLGPKGVIRVGSSVTSAGDEGDSGNVWMVGGFSSWRAAKRCVAAYVKKWPRSATGWRDVGLY